MLEASNKKFTLGGSYTIANFNQVLKLKTQQKNVSNDLKFTLNASMNSNTALIRNFGTNSETDSETNTARATSGTRSWNIDFKADYVVSKRIRVGAFFDYTSNMPLVSTSAYPTSNTNYGLSINMSLVK